MSVTNKSMNDVLSGANTPTIKVVKVPSELHQYRNAVDFGLYSLATGREARQGFEDAAQWGEEKNLKITLSPAGAQCMAELVDSGMTIKQAVVQALLWLSEQPPHLLNARI